jgi:hypothetical protein
MVRQTDGKQMNTRMGTQMDRQIVRQTYRETYQHMGKDTVKEIDRQMVLCQAIPLSI